MEQFQPGELLTHILDQHKPRIVSSFDEEDLLVVATERYLPVERIAAVKDSREPFWLPLREGNAPQLLIWLPVDEIPAVECRKGTVCHF